MIKAKRFPQTCFARVALFPFIAGGSRAETLDQLYEKAKLDKALVFYSGGPAAPHENRAKEFMQKYPGITVSVTGGFSNVLNERIGKQMADRKLEVDMAFFQTVQDFVTWKKQGKLLAFKPEGFDEIMPNFRDEDGTYMALSANALTYAYNISKVRAEDAPKSAQDFLKPMFAGKVITVYPADDDATLYLFHLIVQKYGWVWMDKYMGTKPNFIQGDFLSRAAWPPARISPLSMPLRRSGRSSARESWTSFGRRSTRRRYLRSPAASLRDAPHPNAAKLYLTWFLAKEQQSRLGSFSSRVDVPAPEGFLAARVLQDSQQDREFMTDDKQVSDLRKRFEGYTGPPINKGGVSMQQPASPLMTGLRPSSWRRKPLTPLTRAKPVAKPVAGEK